MRANQDKCIILDEVQRKPDLFPVLRSLIDENRIPARFILLGSANPGLLQLSSESLAGRIVYLELSPFNYLEIKEYTSITTHWLVGGFPEPFLIRDQEIRQEWFKSFIMTYVERDLPMLGLSTSPQYLIRLL